MYLLGERLEEAVNEFKKASELNPDSGLVQVQKLYAEYRLGVTRENTALAAKARAGLQEAIKQYATTPEGYMLLAQVTFVCFLFLFLNETSIARVTHSCVTKCLMHLGSHQAEVGGQPLKKY